jgi:hypothetical protein
LNAHPGRSPRTNRFTRRLVFETLDARRCLASVAGTVFHDADLDGTQAADYLVGPTSAAVAAIIDAQDEPNVEFTSASQVIVTQAANFTISVSLDGPSETAIAIPFAVSGTATAGVDFIIPVSPLIVSAESTSADITVTLLQVQPGETIAVTLGEPDGATLGSNNVHTATVNTPGVADPVVNISPGGPDGAADPDPLPGTDETPTTWASQRTSVRQIVIDLGAPISNSAANDIVLTNLGLDAPVDTDVIVPLSDSQLSLSPDGLQLTISFAANQLPDGVYQLDLLPAISGGATFTTVGNATNKLYVLTGDWNGSGGVNIQDFATFAYWFGSSVPTAPAYVDANDSGGINIQDFAGFAANFGNSITFPGGTTGLKASEAGEGEPDALVAALQNPSDVNGDGRLTARDALDVIHEVERGESSDNSFRFDANRDGRVSIRDALYVVNRLADQPRAWQLALADSNEDDETSPAIDQLLSDEVFARGLS